MHLDVVMSSCTHYALLSMVISVFNNDDQSRWASDLQDIHITLLHYIITLHYDITSLHCIITYNISVKCQSV